MLASSAPAVCFTDLPVSAQTLPLMYPSAKEPVESVWGRISRGGAGKASRSSESSDVTVRNKLCVTAPRLTEALAKVGQDCGYKQHSLYQNPFSAIVGIQREK